MKKKVLVSLVVLLLGASLFAVDFRVSLGQDTTASIEFNKTRGSSVNTQFLFNINAELDMNFKKGHGMVVEVNPYATGGSVQFGVGVGYAYETWIANNVSLLASVGPRFDFGSGGVGFEIFAAVDFDIHVTSSLFVRVGTGVRMDFGTFSNFGDSFNITIPLPAVAVGWRF